MLNIQSTIDINEKIYTGIDGNNNTNCRIDFNDVASKDAVSVKDLDVEIEIKEIRSSFPAITRLRAFGQITGVNGNII